MPTFIGLDLAWGSRNESGACILQGEGDRLQCVALEAVVGTADSFAATAASYGPDTFVAVDAPLIVGEGRMAERQLGRVFGKYKASAYLATPSFLEKMDGMAGPRLATALQARGFSLDPASLPTGRQVAIEVYPHAAHVVLFGLSERLKYKKGRLDARRAGLCTLQLHLRSLFADYHLVLDARDVRAVLSGEALEGPGTALKRTEDKLDALTCAYVAYHAWKHGPGQSRVFGDAESGYILVPWREGFA
jgi:predicted RNase H-like nuclease